MFVINSLVSRRIKTQYIITARIYVYRRVRPVRLIKKIKYKIAKKPVTKKNHNFINITHKFAASLLISFKFEKQIFFESFFDAHMLCAPIVIWNFYNEWSDKSQKVIENKRLNCIHLLQSSKVLSCIYMLALIFNVLSSCLLSAYGFLSIYLSIQQKYLFFFTHVGVF